MQSEQVSTPEEAFTKMHERFESEQKDIGICIK